MTGTWRILEARTTNGLTYTGNVDIQPLGQIYRLTWQTSVGAHTGLGFFYDDHLLVGAGTAEAETYGAAVYRVNADGSLEGRWTLPSSNGQLGIETAIKSAAGDVSGTYQITGSNPAGDGRYQGTLTICPTEETYQLTWHVGSTTYTGVGLRSGDWLVVSWGEPGQFGVLDYAIEVNRANGRWAIPNSPQLGVENLARE